MIVPKPLILPKNPERPARKPKRMTIGIGMLCQDGIIISADTQATNPDGTTYDAVKVHSLKTANGLFGVAYSSEDANAAEMLIGDVLTDMKLIAPTSLQGVEDIVKSKMKEWEKTFHSVVSQSYTAFVLGAIVLGNPVHPERIGLYYCEPPGKILRKTMENSGGYVAIGGGCVVTDPLFRTLFGELVHPRICLAQLSYLMYRAKKDCRGVCGGGTDAVLLRVDDSEPAWITRKDFAWSEKKYGEALDEMLAHVTAKIMSRTGFDDKSRFLDFIDRKTVRGDFGLHGFVFCTRTGEMIREPEFQKMMDDPQKYLES